MSASEAQTRAKEERWAKVQELWSEGKTYSQIAKAMGWSPQALAVQTHRMRAAGIDLPYRYGEQRRKAARKARHG